MSVELLVQILGALCGVGVAWFFDHVFTQRSHKIEIRSKIKYQQELEEYKKNLSKTR